MTTEFRASNSYTIPPVYTRSGTATDDLTRTYEFRQDDDGTDGLTLDGYAAVFNEKTEIHDYMGRFQEQVAPGAFKRTLGQRMPIIQFDHGTHPLIGSIPLGRFSKINEDSHGLKVRARLSDNWLIEPVRDAIRDGGITGMSFKFRVIGEQWQKGEDGEDDLRTITEVELYEAGPVVSPAYEATTVGVRSRQTAVALTDPEVRREVAHLMTLGTDEIRAIADESPAPDSSPAPTTSSDAPAPAPATSRTSATDRARRKAKALLINTGV